MILKTRKVFGVVSKSQRGFTLIETVFFVMIFPTLFLAIFAVLDMANVIFQTNDVYSQLNHSAMQTLRSISREVGQTSPNVLPSHLNITPDDGTGNSSIRFQIPVDFDNDGDVVSGTLDPDVEWGAYNDSGQTSGGTLGNWIRYRVVGTQLQRDVLSGALASVENTTRILSNNVQAFNVALGGDDVLTMTITLQGTDNIGQSGQARNLQTTFTSRTLLRNAVN